MAADADTPMIVFEHVAKRYPGGVQALSDVNFELGRGDMAFLTGHSGAGKSTLLRLIALLERPSRGQVLFDGRNIGRLSTRQIPPLRRRIGVIFHIKPVANLRTFAIYRNRFASDGIQDHNRDQLFGEMIWPVIV